MREEVLKFINVFTESPNKQDIIELFDNKCSYWFATILFRRFIIQNAEIMCDVEHKHFGTKIYGRIYDIKGDVTSWYTWTKWNYVDRIIKEELSEEYIMF